MITDQLYYYTAVEALNKDERLWDMTDDYQGSKPEKQYQSPKRENALLQANEPYD